MYEVETRAIPRRSLLCLKRNVEGWTGAWAFGKEFVGLLKERALPHMEGRGGAFFCIYWGQVSDDRSAWLALCQHRLRVTNCHAPPSVTLLIDPSIGPAGHGPAPPTKYPHRSGARFLV
jgi:hypothetical protein